MISTKHVIEFNDMTRDDVEQIMAAAKSFEEVNTRTIKKLPTLRGRTVVNLFLEPSTRTRTSFELAAKRMSADGINMSGSASATVKGESLVDTAKTLDAMDCDLVILRHKYSGSPRVLADNIKGSVINGGDGLHQHPTQALLDLYTMRKYAGEDLSGKTVGIIGDIAHSRVAGSLVPALRMMGATPVVIAPPSLLPARPDMIGHSHGDAPGAYGAEYAHSLDEVIGDLDIAYMLRVQFERDGGSGFPSAREYAKLFGMNSARAEKLPKHAFVMHPGPMNRGVEISSDMADSDRMLVLQQVNAGVATRMALLYVLLGGEGGE